MIASDVVKRRISESCWTNRIIDNNPNTIAEKMNVSTVVCLAFATDTGKVEPRRIDSAIPKLNGPINTIISICDGIVCTDNGIVPNVPMSNAIVSQ